MSGNDEKNIVILKKANKHRNHPHGGSWKIAYADFVTAMMAFFLLMWLLASLNKAQKAGLAEYFKQPLRIALIGGDSMGARKKTINGGGTDIKQKDGQVKAGDQALEKSQEIKKLEQLKDQVLNTITKDPALADLKNRLLMDVVSEGLRIQLIDNKNKPMFGIGSDEIDPEMLQVLDKIAKILNNVPNKISIQGHTDAHPYHNPEDLNQSNWELSTQRANTARRALIKAGMPEDKVMEVIGYASTVLLDKANPLNPGNRRISIIVMKKDVEAKIIQND
ncbi:flagellar motor protein MotB [Legionella hackeliae]|uniref:Motility protein B n=1 Tax=Legionella hackeliae TaxID=449 RepID=A0A0A8UR46_LEGHA|nr:flagellar motor protein MotB [Legionella hackeliae]KTD10488.1 flagellar motor protein MotB [Legionella hackeliae]CEK09991.1 Motility protein B [Legionella hackeliae]STX49908.1 chemotaxis protein MotB [Legionella hackeliae]